MAKIELGTQLFTFRNVIKNAVDLDKVLKAVKSYGCNVAQLSGVNAGISPKEIRAIADGNGVRIPITHTPFDRIVGETDKVAEEHLVLGAHSVGLGMMPSSYSASADGIKRFIEVANKVNEKLNAYGLKFAYHNHAREFKKMGEERILDVLYKEVENMEFIFDTFWCRYAKCDPVEYLTKLAGRITDIHLKDWKPSLILPRINDVGKGKLDFGSILAVAEAGGTQNAYIEHDLTRDPYKTTRESMEYLSTIY